MVIHRDGQLVSALGTAPFQHLATIPPQGVSPDGGAYDCRWCDMKEVCTGQKKPIKTCRSCQYATVILKDGKWGCMLSKEVLSLDQQREACKAYEVLL